MSFSPPAACPQLVVPHSHDQPDNAARIEALGAGLSINIKHYHARKGAALLGRLTSDSRYKSRCREISKRLDGAAAVEEACDLIERL